MSFGFVVEKETWSVEGKEDIRTLEKVKDYTMLAL